MFKMFYPTVYYESAYDVDFQQLRTKGYRGLLIDIDNTLVEHGAPSSEKSDAFFRTIHEAGWKTCIISNNDENRVKPFAESVHSPYICNAGKPGSAAYLKGMEIMQTDREHTLFMGDQLFTDILGANHAGLRSILVKPVKLDYKIFILIKRAGEAIIKRFYFRYASSHPGEL